MTTTTNINGRLGNQIIRNLAISFIAKKNNLHVNYSNYELINKLGINLFIGDKKYDETTIITDKNYFTLYNSTINTNLNPNNDYFQTKEITNMIYDYLQSIKENIINKNPFKQRYNTNKDLFIHVRLTDVAKFNPGVDYYLNLIKNIHFDKLYISTDQVDHPIINQIINTYTTIIVNLNEIETFQFGSTCANVILSHGSFSAIIGYLSFFSNVYYPEYHIKWFGDMFSISKWNKIKLNRNQLN